MFRSLRTRLFAVILGLIIIGFGGLTLWAGTMMARATYDDVGNSLRVVTVSLANQLTETLEDGDRQVGGIAQRNAESLNGEVAIFNRDGDLLGKSEGASAEIFLTDNYLITENGAGSSIIVANATVLYEGRALGTVQVELPAADAQAVIRDRWLGLGAAFLAFTLLGLFVSSWLLASLTRPLSELQDTALVMAEGDLSQRATIYRQDEIGAVSLAFNKMAARVEAIVAEQKAFAGNAAHELRTPLTTIRLRAEALQAGVLDQAGTEQYVREIEDQAAHMGKLVEDLMALSRADTGRLQIGHERIDACRLSEHLVKEMEAQLAARALTIATEMPDAPTLCAGPSQSSSRCLSKCAGKRPEIYTGRWSHHGDA